MANGKKNQGGLNHMYHLVSMLSHIDELVKEEERLYTKNGLTGEDRARLADVEVALDQCADLLRQRRAVRELDTAKVEPAKIVENYEQ